MSGKKGVRVEVRVDGELMEVLEGKCVLATVASEPKGRMATTIGGDVSPMCIIELASKTMLSVIRMCDHVGIDFFGVMKVATVVAMIDAEHGSHGERIVDLEARRSIRDLADSLGIEVE